MRRIKAACIVQTLHFVNVEGKGSEYGKRKVKEEIKRFKMRMDIDKIRYKVISEEDLEDGSVMMELVREYGNNKSVGNYLD